MRFLTGAETTFFKYFCLYPGLDVLEIELPSDEKTDVNIGVNFEVNIGVNFEVNFEVTSQSATHRNKKFDYLAHFEYTH